jgi:hypothetical protein
MQAKGQPVMKKTFFVVPVRTELQAHLLAGKSAPGCCVFIDGRVFLDKHGNFNKQGLDFAALKQVVKLFDPGTKAIDYHIYLPFEAQRKFGGLIERTLQTKGLQADWEDPRFVWATRANAWEKTSSLFAKFSKTEPPGAEESGLKSGGIKVYPVRTGLSRILTQNADCVIDLAPVWTGKETDKEKQKINKEVSDLVGKMKIETKESVTIHARRRGNFDFDENKQDRAIFDWFAALGKSMGFKTTAVGLTHVPAP